MSNNVISGLLYDLTHLKSGWKTSEFWVAAASVVVSILTVFGVNVSDASTTHFIVVGWDAVAGVYIAARTLIKSVHVGNGASLAQVVHYIEQEGLNVLKDIQGSSSSAQGQVKDPTSPVT